MPDTPTLSRPRQMAIPLLPATSVLQRLSESERHKVRTLLARLLRLASGAEVRENADER
jgi:hypothetical protein